MGSMNVRAVSKARHPTSWNDNLDLDVADDMRDRAARIRKMQQDAVVEVGRQLLAAKQQVAHGRFVAWVQSACQMHIRTAQRVMQAAAMVERHDNLSYLPPDGLLALAAPSAPAGVKGEIVEQITAGARPTAAEIKRQIKTAKDDARRIAAQQSIAQHSDEDPKRATREDAAKQAVDLLYECLGDQFDKFLMLLEEAEDHFTEALRERHARHAEVSPHVDAVSDPEAVMQRASSAAATLQSAECAEGARDGGRGSPFQSLTPPSFPTEGESGEDNDSNPATDGAAMNVTDTASADEVSAPVAATAVGKIAESDHELSGSISATTRLSASNASKLTLTMEASEAVGEAAPPASDVTSSSASPGGPRHGQTWSGCRRIDRSCGYGSCNHHGRCLVAATVPAVAAQAA